jgi:hypothetical protein
MKKHALVQASVALVVLAVTAGSGAWEAGAAPAGNKALIVNVYGEYSTPVPGALVKVVPNKAIPGKEILAQATSNQQGIAEFNDASGNSVPFALIVQGDGLRLLITHPAHQDKEVKVYADELTYTTEPKEVDTYVTPKPPEVRTFTFKGAEVDPLYAKNPVFAVTDRTYSRADPSNGEKYTITVTSPPPASITTGTELTVSVEARIENATWDYALILCWATDPNESPVCGSTTPGSIFFGLHGETKQVTPAARVDIKVKVPARLAGSQPALLFRVLHGMYVETSSADWMRWTYLPK